MRQLVHLAEAPVGHTFGAIAVELADVGLEDRVEQVSSDKCGGNGVKCLPGTSGWRNAFYDKYNSGTCLADYRKYGNSWCAGRCGAGCPKNNWWELISDDDYTRDCFDHDWCTVHFNEDNGSGATHCGDEYDEAVDDYAATVVDYCPE